jgi:hypothetical protein
VGMLLIAAIALVGFLASAIAISIFFMWIDP